MGSSPLARGRLDRAIISAPRSGIIPARARPTCSKALPYSSISDHPRLRGADTSPPAAHQPPGCRQRDHPRLRGADRTSGRRNQPGPGSSPLARGRPGWPAGLSTTGWIIPACAGPTRVGAVPSPAAPDHPRLRGADVAVPVTGISELGSSPLARGRRRERRRARTHARIIPACAGPTVQRPPRPLSSRDHPRLRGADRRSRCAPDRERGSSPLARGRHPTSDSGGPSLRIIPACAGPTRLESVRCCSHADHPRLRGADYPPLLTLGVHDGSSPLARGRPTYGP